MPIAVNRNSISQHAWHRLIPPTRHISYPTNRWRDREDCGHVKLNTSLFLSVIVAVLNSHNVYCLCDRLLLMYFRTMNHFATVPSDIIHWWQPEGSCTIDTGQRWTVLWTTVQYHYGPISPPTNPLRWTRTKWDDVKKRKGRMCLRADSNSTALKYLKLPFQLIGWNNKSPICNRFIILIFSHPFGVWRLCYLWPTMVKWLRTNMKTCFPSLLIRRFDGDNWMYWCCL